MFSLLLLSPSIDRSTSFVDVVITIRLTFLPNHLSLSFSHLQYGTQVIALVTASTAAVSLLVAAPKLAVVPREEEETGHRPSSATSTSTLHRSSPGFRKASARSAIRSNAAPGPDGSKEE